MKNWTRILAVLLLGTLLFSALPALAESGVCGQGLTWTLDEEGTFTVSGKGEMPDYDAPSDAPWAALRKQIKKVVFKGAVTKIGAHAFAECPALTTVTFSTATEVIGVNAFQHCENFSSAYYMEPEETPDDPGKDDPEIPENPEHIPGDVNGDTEVDGRDIIRLMKYLAEEEDIEIVEMNADVNEDGEVDVRDLLQIIRKLGGLDIVLK